MVCSFISCQAKKENSNVVLTDFTKELVSMYINDIENLMQKKQKDEIIIISVTDTLHYYLSVLPTTVKNTNFAERIL